MVKKLFRMYKESFQLAVRFPQFILLFLFSNLITFLDFYVLDDRWSGILFPISFLIRLGALGGIGYVVITIIRRNEAPTKVFSRGVMGNFWRMLQYMVLQLVILTLTSIIPTALLERYIGFPPVAQYFWLWINEYLFTFMIFEAIFWEDKGVGKSYRARNVFMLARFEWMLPVYLIAKIPFITVNLVRMWGHNWLFDSFWVVIPVLFVISLDWVNTIFSFKVYGEDRLQAIQEVEEKVKESSKKMKEKIRQRRAGK